MCILSDRLYLADVTSTNPGNVGNLLADVQKLSFRQICQALEFASGSHVVERSLLKIGLQCQSQANTDKRIPSPPGLVVVKNELKRFFFVDRIFDAADFLPTLQER